MDVAKKPTRRGFVKLGIGALGATALVACAPIEYAMTGAELDKLKPLTDEEIKQLPQKVVEHITMSGNCAQTSFGVLRDAFGLDDGDGAVLKALTSFPGVALRGGTCGGVSGSMMALGLVYGRDELDDREGGQRSMARATAFCEQFEKEYGSLWCGELLEEQVGRPIDYRDPEDNKACMVIIAR